MGQASSNAEPAAVSHMWLVCAMRKVLGETGQQFGATDGLIIQVV